MKKRLTAGWLMIVMLLSMAACFALPAAAEELPAAEAEDQKNYLIESAEDWIEAAKITTPGYWDNAIIHIAKDLDFSGKTVPTFYEGQIFRGTIDGHGHTISNLRITSSAMSGGSMISILGGTIQNLHLSSSCSFTNTNTLAAKVGAFASTTAAGAVIYGCSSAASVSAPNTGDHVGGFVGTANAGIIIDGCIFSGSVTATWQASALVGYHNFNGVMKVQNTLIMGSVVANNTPFGAFRLNGTWCYAELDHMPVYNSYIIGMKFATYNGAVVDGGLSINGHPYNASTMEQVYVRSDAAEAAHFINNNHYDTGREQVWFTLDSEGKPAIGTEGNHFVCVETTIGENKSSAYHISGEELTLESVSGMLPVAEGGRLEGHTLYVGGEDIKITYLSQEEYALRAAKAALQKLCTAYEKMDSSFFADWAPRAQWLGQAKAALNSANPSAAQLQNLLAAEAALSDALAKNILLPIDQYEIYQSVSSVTDYKVSSKEEWLAAVAMSDHTARQDAVDFSGITLHLTKDIDLEGERMLPLCYFGIYNGNINGHGYGFKNIHIEIDAPRGPIGLIAQVGAERTVQNLGVDGKIIVSGYPTYRSEWEISDGGCKVGGIIGRALMNVTVRQCWNDATIEVEKIDNVGGIVGDGRFYINMDGCLNRGSVGAGMGIIGYGRAVARIYNTINAGASSAAIKLNKTVADQQDPEGQLQNIYSVVKTLQYTDTAANFTADQKQFMEKINGETAAVSAAEAAWRANRSYTHKALGTGVVFRYTMDEDGQIALGNIYNQVRRITLKCAGREDQYIYAAAGSSVALRYDLEVNYFTLEGNYKETSLEGNLLQLGNEDVTVFVAYNVWRGDVSGNKKLETEDAVLALRMAVGLMDRGDPIAADVNSNGYPDVMDALQIVRSWLGSSCGFEAGLPRETKADFIKLASYNIKAMHYDFATGGSKDNRAAVLEELRALDADIIGLQEVDHYNTGRYNYDQMKYLTENLGYEYYHYTPTVGSHYGTAVMSRYPILRSDDYYFAGLAQENGARLDGLEPRAFSRHMIDTDRDDNADLIFYNCHLGNYTYAQLKYMMRYMEADRALGYPVCCTGDFNLRVWEMQGAFDAAQFTPLNGGDDLSYCERTTLDGYGALLSSNESAPIDNIFVSEELEAYWDAGRDCGIFVVETTASDHFPIYTYIRLSEDQLANEPQAEIDYTTEEWITVASYNVKVLYYDHVNMKNGQPMTKFDAVCEEIRRMDADIIGLQELDRFSTRCGTNIDQLKELADALGYRYSYYTKTVPSYGANSEYGHGILSRYPITKSESFYFADCPGNIDGTEPRGYSRSELDIYGKKVVFYNTHLANYSTEQMAVITQKMKADMEAGDYALLTGDMNATPAQLASGVAEGCTMLNTVEAPQNTFYESAVKGILNPIDNIVVTDNLDYYWDEELQSGIIVNQTPASDHFPIYTHIRIPKVFEQYRIDESGTPLSILCQNLRYNAAADQGTENSIAKRRYRFQELVKKYDPDIITAQECCSTWIDILQQDYGDEYGMYYHYRNPVSGSNEATPVLWKKDKYTLVDSGNFWLSETPEVSSPSFVPGYYPRVANWVSLKDKATGVQFNIYSTHFGFDYTAENVEAIQQLFLKEFKKFPDAYCFVTGDFNINYGTDFYDIILDNKADLFDLRPVAERMEKHQHCRVDDIRAGTFNGFSAENGTAVCDYIAAAPRKNLAVDYFTYCYEKLGSSANNVAEGFVSDHFAVYAEVRMNTTPSYASYY